MKRFKIKRKKTNSIPIEELGISKKNKEIALKIVELEKKAQKDSNFDYVTEMEKIISENKLSMGDMVDIDFYIQNKNLLTK